MVETDPRPTRVDNPTITATDHPEWSVEQYGPTSAWLVHNGTRVAPMSLARAHGIAAACNTPEGSAAFHANRLTHTGQLRARFTNYGVALN